MDPMRKWKVLSRIVDAGLVAVVRADNLDQAKRIAEACYRGGVAAIEITYTVPGATKVIEELAATYEPEEMIIGAGTVLDPETARIAILAGAQYVVSPSLNLETLKLCNRYQVPCMPGISDAQSIISALEYGADIVKLFPGELYGPKAIQAFKGPIPQALFMPTGGVSLDNVEEWIKAGAVAVGVGGSLTGGAKTGDYASIEALAKQFIIKIQKARREG